MRGTCWGPIATEILCPIPWCDRAWLKYSTYSLITR